MVESGALVFSRSRKYHGRRTKHAKITYNMGVLLHYILTSIEFRDGEFILNPAEDTKKLLNTFCNKDIVDTYSRLGLNQGLYGDSLVSDSRKYVLKKQSFWYLKFLRANKIKRD